MFEKILKLFTFKKQNSSSNCSPGHVGSSYNSLAETFSLKVWKFFAQSPKLFKKILQFQKNVFLQIVFFGQVECSFCNPADFLLPKVRNFVAQFWRELKSFISSKNIVCLRKFLWSFKMLFWETCRNFFPKVQNFFCSKCRTDLEKLLSFHKKSCSLRHSSGNVDCNFDNRDEMFSPEVHKIR